MLTKKSTFYIISVILGLLIIAAGVFYYFHYYQPAVNQPAVNFLIQGVPYYGIYNHFFDANYLYVTSVADILGYWGDERFSLADLKNKFVELGTVGPGNISIVTTANIQKFFQDNGYETYRWNSAQAGGEISQIKKFVNAQQKIPVIVYQKRSFDPSLFPTGFRVVIGISDSAQKVTVQDHDYGNNYEISYQDFEKMFDPNSRAILAVWPSDKIKNQIKGPNYNLTYPPRLKAMNESGESLIKAASALNYFRLGDYENALQLYQKFMNDPAIADFPPAYLVKFYTFLSEIYQGQKKYDEAIKIINEKALPINHDLSKAYDGWANPTGDYFSGNKYSTDKFWGPYYALGVIYQTTGKKELAKENFQEALKIYPNGAQIQSALEKLK